MRPRYRVRQFRDHIRATVSDAERETAHARLPAGAAALFDAMPVADQRHALDVAALLDADGHHDPDLIAAALLHDAGKGPRLRLWHRVVVVLVEFAAPGRVAALATADPRSWRYPFYLQVHHAELSAQAALAVGRGPRVAAFITNAPTGTDTQLAAALQAADAAS